MIFDYSNNNNSSNYKQSLINNRAGGLVLGISAACSLIEQAVGTKYNPLIQKPDTVRSCGRPQSPRRWRDVLDKISNQ